MSKVRAAADGTARRRNWRVARMFGVVVVAGAATLGLGVAPASSALVTVTLDGSAKGSVTSDPAGINCSNVPGAEKADCSVDFPLLTVVKLTASPGTDAVLKGWTGTAGGTCAGQVNPCMTSMVFFNPLDATATFSPRPDTPLVGTGTASDVVFPSATLSGTVNPNSSDFGLSDCYFEYGTSNAYGTKTPCRPGTVGPGTGTVAVTGTAASLEPGAVYHYRIVAANAGGSSVGEDLTLTAATAPADPCPNAAIRAQQHVLARTLPDCRAYELVGPPSSYGQAVTGIGGAIAPDGNSLALGSLGAFADAGNAPDLGGAFSAERTPDGWRVVPLIPPATLFPTWLNDSAGGIDFTADGRSALWWVQRREDKNTKRLVPVLADSTGRNEIVGPTVDDGTNARGSIPIATSADLRTMVIASFQRNFSTDGAPDTRSAAWRGLYVSRPSPDDPGGFRVRQLAFRAGATMLGPTCGVQLGGQRSARGAVSNDGRRIIFSFGGSAGGASSCLTAPNQRVWVRDGDAEVEDLSATRCSPACGPIAPAYFEVASYDGQRVYFTTNEKLLPGDQDDSAPADLYVHDTAYATNNRLRAVTASGSPGPGAGVLGVVRASDDGAYVYFVANGRPLAGINARGDSPQAGDNNLYVYHRPRSPLGATETIDFVTKLDEATDVNRDLQFSLLNVQNRPAVISSDGRYLFFVSYSNLTGEKQTGDTDPDGYRYDVETDELTRIWSPNPQHNGTKRVDGIYPVDVGPTETGFDGARQRARRQGQAISDDGGTIAFTTAEPLSVNDTNTLRDVYMWREDTGKISLVSSAKSVRDLNLAGVSRNGDVFFADEAPLVPEHRSGVKTTFVARQGGGFASPPPLPVPCSGDPCQGAEAPAPGPFAGAGSSTFVGGENAVPPIGEPESKGQAKVRVAKMKAVRGTRARVRVEVPAKGKIRVSGSGLARVSKSTRKAGTYRVTVKLSKRARHSLRRKHRVKVRMRVQFTPAEGKSSVVRRSVTFKAGRKRSSKASSRSVRRVGARSSTVDKER